MTPVTCTKCGAIVATINAGKIIIDRVQMRVLERDTQGALHCVCICGSKKTFRPSDWLSTAPTTYSRGRKTMTPVTCTKCGAIVATINAGKIIIDRVQMRVLERDTRGALHCVCNCGSKKTFRPSDWLSTTPVARCRGRRVA